VIYLPKIFAEKATPTNIAPLSKLLNALVLATFRRISPGSSKSLTVGSVGVECPAAAARSRSPRCRAQWERRFVRRSWRAHSWAARTFCSTLAGHSPRPSTQTQKQVAHYSIPSEPTGATIIPSCPPPGASVTIRRQSGCHDLFGGLKCRSCWWHRRCWARQQRIWPVSVRRSKRLTRPRQPRLLGCWPRLRMRCRWRSRRCFPATPSNFSSSTRRRPYSMTSSCRR